MTKEDSVTSLGFIIDIRLGHENRTFNQNLKRQTNLINHLINQLNLKHLKLNLNRKLNIYLL